MKNIPFAKANLGKEEIDAVSKVLKSGWVTMSNETIEFEKEFAKYTGSKYAIAVNSCTSALFLALKALNIQKGDEIIIPSLTFAATVNVVLHVDAKPVFADVKKEDLTLDPKDVQKKTTKKTKIIMPVHIAGRKAFTGYSLPVVEDSAHLIQRGKRSNNLACYSFYANKNMTCGEGGMITTNSLKLAKWLRKARLHGMSKDAWKRYINKNKWKYDVEFPGYKFNTTDINSSIGRVQLKKLPYMEKEREKIVSLYNQLLGLNNTGNHLYQIFIEKRSKFIEYMSENGVQCSVHFLPVHKMKAYRNYKTNLPITEYVGQRLVSLPLYPSLSTNDIEYICNLVKKFKKNNE